MNIPSTGVIVGRFQVPELHDGHLELFRTVRSIHERVVVFIGLSPTRNATRRHPLDFETRRRMIQAKFPEFSVMPLADKRTDVEWSQSLDNEIDKLRDWGKVILYGSRDSFIPHYNGKYAPRELSLLNRANGTAIRDSLTNTVKESYDFRAGIIYSSQNRRPHVYTAVDIAILHSGVNPIISGSAQIKTYVLLAQKSGFDMWRFPGGYSDPDSASFEADARREAYEETGLSLGNLEYITSSIIKDWRYEKEEDKIKSMLFKGWSLTLGGKAADDISEVQWFELSDRIRNLIVPEHRDFFDILLTSEVKSNEMPILR